MQHNQLLTVLSGADAGSSSQTKVQAHFTARTASHRLCMAHSCWQPADGDGKILGQDAVKFFQRSGLPQQTLAKVTGPGLPGHTPQAHMLTHSYAGRCGRWQTPADKASWTARPFTRCCMPTAGNVHGPNCWHPQARPVCAGHGADLHCPADWRPVHCTTYIAASVRCSAPQGTAC